MIGRPQDVFPFLAPLRPALVFTVLTLAAVFLGNNKVSMAELFKSKEGKKYALFYLIMILGIPLAYHRREAFNYIFLAYIIKILYFYIFLIQVDSFKKLKSILFTICLSTLFYGAFSLARGQFFDGRFYFGTMFDPNDLAYFLASLFPVSVFYIVHDEGALKKMCGILTVCVSLAAILVSGSRGGLLGVIGIFMFFLFTRTGGIKKSYKLGFLITVLIVFIAYSSKINMERYMSLRDISSDYNVSSEQGRLDIWAQGIGLLLANPITGVGVNCFPMAIGYKREAEGLPPKWQATHNSFIQIATEVGVIGFIAFFSMIWGSFKNFGNLKKTSISSPEAYPLKTIAGLLQMGFVASLITSFFLSQGYSILFTLFFAFSALLKKLQSNLINNRTA